jgi:hypothetical protein
MSVKTPYSSLPYLMTDLDVLAVFNKSENSPIDRPPERACSPELRSFVHYDLAFLEGGTPTVLRGRGSNCMVGSYW